MTAGRCIKLFAVIAMVIAISMAAVGASAKSGNQFPEGVIEIPQGTAIGINESAGTVTIMNCRMQIKSGDTFVVYLQDLPIGYVAKSVEDHGDYLVIETEKADKSVYGLLDQEGIIELTPDTYEFIPAPNVSYAYLSAGESRSATIGGNDGLSYSDGKLAMGIEVGGSYAQVYLSNLSLSHSISDGNISIALNGNWGIETLMSISDDSISSVPLGELRIAGVGKIAVELSINQEMAMKCNLSGTFSAGVTAGQDGSGTAIKGFSVDKKSVEGTGMLGAGLKVSAGVDILVAAADLFVEVGVTTQYTSLYTTDPDTNISVHCDDFRIYMYSTVGAEAKYYSVTSGKMKPLAAADVELAGADQSPVMVCTHLENGVTVSSCTQGMEVPERHYGGVTASFGSTILSDNRDRIMETNVSIPWDVTIDGDYTIANGNLNVNGYTLTINGDLIQKGGTVTVGTGKLVVNGNYRIQDPDNSSLDSTGDLNISNGGELCVNGDFIVQTSSSNQWLSNGTIRLNGHFYQKNTEANSSNFNSGHSLRFEMAGSGSSTIHFESPEDNSIGHLVLLEDATVNSDVRLGKANLGGYELAVNGNMATAGDVALEAGLLTVAGSVYHNSGTLYVNEGRADVCGNYYMVGAESSFDEGTDGFVSCDSYLNMTNDADEIHVSGDFVAKTNYTQQLSMTAGTLYIGGDFTQLKGLNANNFDPVATHTTVLNGSGTQVISFESPTSGFGTLRTTNNQLVFRNAVNWLKQESDIHAESDGAALDSRDIDLNGYELEIDGNIKTYSNINVSGGKLTVNGSLYQHYRNMVVGKGCVNVSGGYYMVSDSSNLEEGNEEYVSVDAYLHMVNDEDEVHVGEDFVVMVNYPQNQVLTAGTLYVGGDFTQLKGLNAYNFNPGVTHKTVLNGSGMQVISFEAPDAGFGTLAATNDQLVFRGAVNWLKQASDIHATSDGAALDSRDIDLNGYELEIDGDIKTYSNINVSGGRLTVNGSLYQHYRTINIGKGSMDVSEDYFILADTSILEEGNEEYVSVDAYLKMVNAEDEVRVGDDFLMKTNYPHNVYLTAGTLYVGGDFTQLKGLNAYNFNPVVTHTTVLNGSGTQVISFEAPDAGFGTLAATNDQLVFRGAVSWLKQASDLHAKSDGAALDSRDIDLNGYELEIDGDIKTYSNIHINDGRLTVNGSLYQHYRTINIGKGSMEVSGDYFILADTSVLEEGNEEYVSVDAYLKMVNDEDEVRVGDDFLMKTNYPHNVYLTAGTLYVGGDFTQLKGLNAYNFNPGVTHKTVLNGSGMQVISFEAPDAGFGTLAATNDQLVFRGAVNWLKQASDIHATSDGAALDSRDIDLNGYELEIDGDIKTYSNINVSGGKLTVNGSLYQHYRTINIGKGSMDVSGDYFILADTSVLEEGNEEYVSVEAYLKMVNAEDEVRVGDDFLMKTNYPHNVYLTAGTLYVGGDFTQLKGLNAYNFNPVVTHTTVLNGSGTQVISFEAPNAGFGTLAATNDQLVFRGSINWLRQASNIYAASDGAALCDRAIDLNGYELMVDGDVTVKSSVDFNGGRLIVNGTLLHQNGTMYVHEGLLAVRDDYQLLGENSSIEEDVYNSCDSILKMVCEKDEVRVGGDMITAAYAAHNSHLTKGTLYLSGDFYQYTRGNVTNFAAQLGHKTVLCGPAGQNASFESVNSHFGTLSITQPFESYAFEPNPCWLALEETVRIDRVFTLPVMMTSIEADAFAGNVQLGAVKANNTKLEEIGNSAFRNCWNLSQVALPKTVTYIAPDAFDGCTNVKLLISNVYCEQYATENGIEYEWIE